MSNVRCHRIYVNDLNYYFHTQKSKYINSKIPYWFWFIIQKPFPKFGVGALQHKGKEVHRIVVE